MLVPKLKYQNLKNLLGVSQYNIAGFDTQGTACYTIPGYLLVSGTPTILVTNVFFASVNHYKSNSKQNQPSTANPPTHYIHNSFVIQGYTT